MSENLAQRDVHEFSMRAIRQASTVMESTTNEDFHAEVSSLRSDLMNIAGLSSGYDSRPRDEVAQDFRQHGEARVQGLIEQAGKLGDDGAASLLAGLKTNLHEGEIIPKRSISELVEKNSDIVNTLRTATSWRDYVAGDGKQEEVTTSPPVSRQR